MLGSVAWGQLCPFDGDCCVANGTPGCNEFNCCDEVCTQDPFCCDQFWDSLCASSANSTCAICGAGCPGLGNCCEANGTPACDNFTCCEAVCVSDPFCCDTNWDNSCGQAALGLCGECVLLCPGAGDCCANNGTPGCDETSCCELVCALDSFCCDGFWDALCANMAIDLCAGCAPCGPVALNDTNTFILPDQAFAGTQLTVVYEIDNAGPCDFIVAIATAIREIGTPDFITSPECDATLTSLGGQTQSFSTCFNLPQSLVPGLYEVCYTLSDGISGTVLDAFCATDLVILSQQGDLDGDERTGTSDMLMLIGHWGDCEACFGCVPDLDLDCDVDVPDFLTLLGYWGLGG